MMRFSLIVMLCSFLLFVSCEKEIEFEGELTAPKLVVNSAFSNDTVWNVNVSNSLSVLDINDIEDVENAIVTIKEVSGSFVEALTYNGSGNYTSTSFPEVGKKYRIDVAASSYESVYAESIIPVAVSILTVDTSSNAVVGVNEEPFNMTITVDDPIGVENFYKLSVSSFYYNYIYDNMGNIIDSNLVEKKRSFVPRDIVLDSDEGYFTELTTFSDALFDGSQRKIKVGLGFDFFFSPNEFYEINLCSLSEDLYLYYKTFGVDQEVDPFSQPVQIHANITNGIGIFGGFHKSVYRFEP